MSDMKMTKRELLALLDPLSDDALVFVKTGGELARIRSVYIVDIDEDDMPPFGVISTEADE